MQAVRRVRNAKLKECDWVVLRAVSRNEPVPQEWVDYMQALRDITSSDINPVLEDGVLKISGATKTDDSTNYLYKGIAERAFTRTFSLADTVEVKNADLINGMLKIWLENIIPESKKPKKVDIGGGEKEFLAEDGLGR